MVGVTRWGAGGGFPSAGSSAVMPGAGAVSRYRAIAGPLEARQAWSWLSVSVSAWDIAWTHARLGAGATGPGRVGWSPIWLPGLVWTVSRITATTPMVKITAIAGASARESR